MNGQDLESTSNACFRKPSSTACQMDGWHGWWLYIAWRNPKEEWRFWCLEFVSHEVNISLSTQFASFCWSISKWQCQMGWCRRLGKVDCEMGLHESLFGLFSQEWTEGSGRYVMCQELLLCLDENHWCESRWVLCHDVFLEQWLGHYLTLTILHAFVSSLL